MKKLMFGLAIAAVGTAFAVESSNIVGYQQLDTNEGLTYLAPTFQKVDGSALAIADLVPTGDDAGFGTEVIQTFDAENYVSGYYTYYIEDSGAAPEGNGWYDEDGALADVELGTGIGVLFESNAAKVQVAGQVAKGEVTISDVNAGLTYVCNPTPAVKNIQDFVPTGDNAGFGTEVIQTFDSENYVVGYYTYYIEDSGAAPEGNGWYDEDGNLADVSFDPGWGFLFESNGDCTVKVPAAVAL